jgi:hypothetical protein
MICPSCDEERKKSDFYGKEKCYKCIYQDKLGKVESKRTDKVCKICGEHCEEGRWSYCSDKCARDGKRTHDANYWTTKLKNSPICPTANNFTFRRQENSEE